MKMIELLGGIVIGSVVAFTLKEKIKGPRARSASQSVVMFSRADKKETTQ